MQPGPIDRVAALIRENAFLREELAEPLSFPRILGTSHLLAETFRQVRKHAAGAAPILLVGEPGTGKSLLARAIHHLGPRREGRFVTLDCGEPRAGEDDRLDRAGRGTLHVRHLDAAPGRLRSELASRVERGTVAIVASTDREPGAERFLGGSEAVIHVPPLRDRDEDVLLLADHFLKELGRRQRRESSRFSADARESLRAHPWPGNVRELRVCVERALLVAEGEAIEPRHLALGPPHRAAPSRGAREA